MTDKHAHNSPTGKATNARRSPMTHNRDSTASSAGDTASDDLVTLEVTVRREHIALLRRFATREGASVEAMASLWLEEKADEAMRASRSSSGGQASGGGE
ncbi:MAG TPA: hypothetical protein VFH60_03040 [Chloroflexia bacterium]|nr:hypothetical protein [Chloroflexia bacterium]